ncbi:hypothetical protein CKM354_001211700 [Cercospora kikuchii]|uniref:Uncharacterized protein n=1 Tax=Cercospora kikuchii TaxID=84275 RepID=A0A9P3CTL0_9PEZI|nr:uncharacterized protein CKM354_001211700 [Cercospora kikuchii]GIZ49077.1 hypothetical protein CKM354_001211700 [Cercospora kikuchii]
MDPSNATRKDGTDSLVSQPLPDDANAEWKRFADAHRDLLGKLAYHDAMSENLQDTYMTPARSKNRVYFMWDFVGRTLGMIYNLPPAKNPERYNEQQKETYHDVISRSVMSKSLLTDQRPGMLNMMIESTNPEQRGRHPELGADILAAANALPV